jgi:glucose-6-phosphate isomerase
MNPHPPFAVSLDLALGGAGAPDRARYDAALANARRHMEALKGASSPLELFTNIARRDDLERAASVATVLRDNANTIFVLGIGGSSLGGQALKELAPGGGGPRVVFLDNPDPVSFPAALAACDLATARFVAISKSGGTAETLAQVLVAAEALRRAGCGHALRRHFAVITEPKPSPLRAFAEALGCPTLDHPLGIGGRYSVLSMVGLLPALLMGLDAAKLRDGAQAVLDDPHAAVEGAALHHALAIRETVLWSYCDRLKVFGPWWRQLWAESLGKDGQGTTPVAALGPVDQHSQLQLFLAGPGGALFTLIGTGDAGPAIPAEDADRLGLSYLAGQTLGALVDAELHATAETLAAHGRPVRRIHVPALDERALGGLFMHFMLETILTGRLMGVDPFDQPAVEEGKRLARAYLEAAPP